MHVQMELIADLFDLVEAALIQTHSKVMLLMLLIASIETRAKTLVPVILWPCNHCRN